MSPSGHARLNGCISLTRVGPAALVLITELATRPPKFEGVTERLGPRRLMQFEGASRRLGRRARGGTVDAVSDTSALAMLTLVMRCSCTPTRAQTTQRTPSSTHRLVAAAPLLPEPVLRRHCGSATKDMGQPEDPADGDLIDLTGLLRMPRGTSWPATSPAMKIGSPNGNCIVARMAPMRRLRRGLPPFAGASPAVLLGHGVTPSSMRPIGIARAHLPTDGCARRRSQLKTITFTMAEVEIDVFPLRSPTLQATAPGIIESC